MKKYLKIALIFYFVDLIIFYLPEYLFSEIQLIEGIMGINTEFFYTYGYIYILIIAMLSALTYKFLFEKKYDFYKWILLLFVSYFTLISTSIILYAISKNDFLSFMKILEAYLVGIFIIVYSPFTYIVIIINYFVGFFYKRNHK